MALMTLGASAQTWSFAGEINETTDVYASDEVHWGWVDSRWNYKVATNNEPLMVGTEEAELTKGLKFKAGAANSSGQGKLRRTKNQFQLNGNNIVVTIPALKTGYTVEVSWKTGSNSDYTRYLAVSSNVTSETFKAAADGDTGTQTSTGTVNADGDVTLTSTGGGVNLNSITVKDGSGNVLTKEQVIALANGGSGSESGGSGTVWDFKDLTTGTSYTATTEVNGLYLQLKSGHSMSVEDVANSQKTFTLSNGTACDMTHKITMEGAASASSDPIESAMTKRRNAAEGMNLDYMALDVTGAGTLYVIARANDNNAAREVRLGFQKGDNSYSVLSKSEAKKDLVELKGEVTEAGTYFIYGSIKMSVQTIVWVPAGSATGIRTVQGDRIADDNAMYNLRGQKVDASYKGVVIKNGKKYLIK